MNQFLQRFTQNFQGVPFIRQQIRANGFKLIQGTADVEFWMGGRMIGQAAGLQDGEGIFGVEFDQVKIAPVVGSVPVLSWYIATGQFQTDRVQNTVETSKSFRAIRAQEGYKVAWSKVSTSGAIRWTCGLFILPDSLDVAAVTSVYASRVCKLFMGALPAGVGIGAEVCSSNQVIYADAATSGNFAHARQVSGEIAPSVSPFLPAAAWVNGRLVFDDPVVIYPGFGLYVQDVTVSAAALQVACEWIEQPL